MGKEGARPSVAGLAVVNLQAFTRIVAIIFTSEGWGDRCPEMTATVASFRTWRGSRFPVDGPRPSPPAMESST